MPTFREMHSVKKKKDNTVNYKNETVKPLTFTLWEEASSPLIPTTTAPAFLNFSYESLKAQACNILQDICYQKLLVIFMRQ